jgi:hypothetical protein
MSVLREALENSASESLRLLREARLGSMSQNAISRQPLARGITKLIFR